VKPTSPRGPTRGGRGRPSSGVPEPLIRVGDDFENEYPGASALATECFANLFRTGDLLVDLHNVQARTSIGSPERAPGACRGRGAGRPLEPSEIARRSSHHGHMTSVLDTLEGAGSYDGYATPTPPPSSFVDITQTPGDPRPALPSLHARGEREVISGALSTTSNASSSASSPESTGGHPGKLDPTDKRRVRRRPGAPPGE